MKYGFAHGNMLCNRGDGFAGWWRSGLDIVKGTGGQTGFDLERSRPKTPAVLRAEARHDRSDPFAVARMELYLKRGLT